MTSLTPFEPGSIKDRILMSAYSIGSNATRSAIHKCVEGQAQIIEIAIDALVRDGYLQAMVSADGLVFEVNDELKQVLQAHVVPKKFKNITTDPLQVDAWVESSDITNTKPPVVAEDDWYHQPEDPEMNTTTEMKTCHGKHSKCKVKEQPAINFYTGQACCKECFGAKYNKKAKTTKAKTAKVKTVKKPKVLEDLVIPATGDITCTRIENGVQFTQDNDVIVCSAGQLAALYNWVGAYMEMNEEAT